MDKEKKIEQKVEKILDCLDQFERIQPNSFFISRVVSKIQDSKRQKKHSFRQIFSFATLRPVFLVLIIILNLISAFLILPERDSAQDSRNAYIESLITEYNLNQSYFYNNFSDEQRQ